MGNCVSRSQLIQSTNTSEGPPEKRSIASEQPPCPAFPIKEPTQSFWTFPPSPIATHVSSDNFPTHADVVIIGSGISGASFARTLFDIDQARSDNSDPLSVVMLEAHETCSGATGRNGGHINPPLYHDYEDLKRSIGKVAAQQIMRFRLAHLDVLTEVAEAEADDAGCREVHSVEAFFDDRVFEEAKRKLGIYKAEMPQEASTFHIWEGDEARSRYDLSSLAIGCITTRAGAVHPYRFVIDILVRLLEEYPKYFQLFTQTPCTSITEPSPTNPFYSLATPRGKLTASHVVHLTNAYVGALVPGLASAVYRIRETMSAQRPGRALELPARNDGSSAQKNHGGRSYIFYDSPEQKGFDYLTQLPDGEHELMFGGGLEVLPEDETGCGSASRGTYDVHSAAHVSGALPVYFGATNWGAEGIPAVESSLNNNVHAAVHGQLQSPWAAGRVKALWSGVLSVSVDEFPWVGRIPRTISGRRSPTPLARTAVSEKGNRPRTADPGEWVAVGYSGEGMVHAWLCARALALMVLGLENTRDVEAEGRYGAEQTVEEWLPACYRISVERQRSACKAWKGLTRSGRGTVVRGGGGKMKIYGGL